MAIMMANLMTKVKVRMTGSRMVKQKRRDSKMEMQMKMEKANYLVKETVRQN